MDKGHRDEGRKQAEIRKGRQREGANRREQRESIEGLNSASLSVSRGRGGRERKAERNRKGKGEAEAHEGDGKRKDNTRTANHRNTHINDEMIEGRLKGDS